jgi:hypothetical protein
MKKHHLFIIFFFLSLVYYRIGVYVKNGSVSSLRALTGLKVHHYHYGVLLLTIGVILVLIYGLTKLSSVILGFGLGSTLDGFISSLFSSTNRVEEIINYTNNLVPTTVMFIGIALIIILFYKKR